MMNQDAKKTHPWRRFLSLLLALSLCLGMLPVDALALELDPEAAEPVAEEEPGLQEPELPEEPTEPETEALEERTEASEPETEASEEEHTEAPAGEPAAETPEEEEAVTEAPMGDLYGECVNGMYWNLDDAGTLKIFANYGNGAAMPDYTEKGAPWYGYRNQIKSIEVDDDVTGIGAYAFAQCEQATSVTISYDVTSIGGHAFSGCKNLTSVTIPTSVTSIGEYAFVNCNSLTGITIPASVTSIGEAAFYSCPSLTGIAVAEGNSAYSAGDGVLYNKAFTTLLQYPGGKEGHFTIPDGVTGIGFGAFAQCDRLTGVTIPDSVTSLGYASFFLCKKLKSVTIPDSVTDMDERVFYSCPILASVKIGNGVTSIPNYAFANCGSLTSVTIGYGVTSIDDEAFKDSQNLSVIYGYTNSFAQTWAGNKFESIGTLFQNVEITVPDQTYTGSALTPAPTVVMDGTPLTLGTDYTVSYSNNIDPGTAIITVTGKGNYAGTATGTFTINPASLAAATVTASNQTWTGKKLTPAPTVVLNGKTLTEGTDYTAAYSNNVNAGTATITVTGAGNYSGTASGTFTIDRASLAGASVTAGAQPFTGNALTPAPTVKLNEKTLTQGTDYNVAYSNNVNAGTATITVTGAGNYSGTASGTFQINKANQTVTLTGKTAMYVGCTQTLNAKGTGKISWKSSNAKVATVSAKGVVTTKAAGTVKITATAAGDGNHNKASKTLTITVKKYATPKVTKVENVQGGVKLTLKLTKGAAKHRILYKTGKGKWTKLVDTTASTYTWKKAKNGTKYTFTVRCVTADGKLYTSDQDNTGKSITYVASPTLTSVKNTAAGTAAAEWGELTGVSGFQIQYSTSKTFKSGNKTVTVKKPAATSQTITGLSKSKTYHFRIRSYKTVSGKAVYSAWSAAKSLKIKK